MRAYPALRTPPLRMESFDGDQELPHRGARARQPAGRLLQRIQPHAASAADNNSLDSTFGQITNLSSQISNRQGQATFRVEF